MRILASRYRIEELDQYLAKRDYAAALSAIAEELKKRPDNFNLLLRKAEILGLAGNREHAIQVYRDLAKHFAKKGRYSMAVAVTNKILRLDPTQTQAAEELSELLEAQRRAEEEARSRFQYVTQKATPDLQTPPLGPEKVPQAPSAPPQPTPEQQDALRFFSAIPAPALAELLASTSVRTYGDGAKIVREGEPGDSLFLIVEGTVDVIGTDPKGQAVSLATLRQGDFFGEVAVLTGKPRTATVVAKENVAVIEISKSTLEDTTKRYPEMKEVLERFYRERASATVELMLAHLRGRA
ncbi:MAG: cyclic nucleotide-binding domain-containing protein [Thermoanaerobaculaceae bacterium]